MPDMVALLQADLNRPARLARYCIARLGLRPPIDVLAVARACGVPVLPQPPGGPPDVDALLAYHTGHGAWAIFVDPRRRHRRRRFSIAHELGHFLLHRRLIQAGQPLDDPRFEREANEFASELLMPAGVLEATVHQMQQLFDVSEAAVRIRLLKLGVASPRDQRRKCEP